MASGNIKGITIEIGGDTKGLDSALKGVNKQSKDLQKELKEVEKGLKFDPGNVELIRQKQELLTASISSTSDKLDVLKNAQSQVQAQFDRGEIGVEQYRAFQRELQNTETELNGLRTSMSSIQGEQSRLSSSTNALGTLFEATGTNVDQFSSVLGTRLTRAIKDGSASADQIDRAIRLIGQSALGSEIDIEELNRALRQVDDGGSIDDVRDDLADLTEEADESGDSVNGFGQKLSGIVGVLGKVAVGTVVAVGAIGAAVFGLSKPLIRAAGDLEALNAQFSIVFGELEGAATKSLERIGTETGVATARLKGTFTQIAAFAKTSGADTAAALDISSRATLAAADSAAFYDKSIEEVADSLQSFLKGNFANDAALGLSATEFTRNSAALELFGDKFKDLTELQKQETLLKMVEDANKLGGAAGQANREMDGLENVLGNLDSAFTSLKAALGGLIFDLAIEGIKSLTNAINNFDITPIVETFNRFKEVVSSVLDVVVPFVQEKLLALKAMWDSEGGGIVASALAIFEKIKGVVQDVLNAVIPFVQEQLGKLKKFWDENGTQILEAVTNAFNGIKAIIEFIMPAIKFIIDVIWTAIKQVITGALDVIMGAVKIFSGLFTGDFGKMWEGVKQLFIGAINLIIGWFSLTFVGGIRTLITNLGKSSLGLVKTMWTNIVGAFKSAGANLLSFTDDVLVRVINYFKNFGTSVSTQMNNARQSIVDIWNKAVSFLKGIDLKQIGKNIIDGLVKGIGASASMVTEKIKDIAKSILQTFKNVLDINSPSRETEKLGGHTGQGFANGVIKKKAAVVKAAKEVANAAKKNFETNMKNLSLNFKAGKIDSTQYANSLEDLKSKYKTVPLAIAKVDSEIATLRTKNTKALFDADKKYLQDKVKYGNISLTEEVKILQSLAGHYKKNSEERIFFENKVKDTKIEITKVKLKADETYLSKVQKLNEDYLSQENKLTESYKKTVEDRKQALINYAGLFDEVSLGNEITGSKLLANLQGQNDVLEQWVANLGKLVERGLDEGLIAELQALGPKSAAEIAALNTLSDSELNQYVELWKNKSELARKQAVSENEDLRIDVANQILALQEETAKNLKGYQEEWKASMKAVTTVARDQLKSMPSIGSFAVQGLIDGMNSRKSELERVAAELAAIVAGTVKSDLDINSPSRIFRNFGVNIGQGLIKGMDEMISKVSSSSQRLTEAVSNAQGSLSNSTKKSVQPNESVYSVSKVMYSNPLSETLAPQPVYISLNLGGRDYEILVDDITKTQNRKQSLERKYNK